MMGPAVLGVGWCRTGTSTLKVALDELGFGPCFHGRFIPYLPEFREHCYAYATGKQKCFPTKQLFDSYGAVVDIPPGLIPLVLQAYPDAKVVLTVRDPDAWHASVQQVIVRLYRWLLRPLFWTTRTGRQYTAIIGWGLSWMFGGDMSKENCIRAFHAHSQWVAETVPKERLLQWRPQDGWEPLARFLEVQVPAAPFPAPQNEGSAEMLRQAAKFMRRHPTAAVGITEYSHTGPLTFDSI